MSQNLQLSSMVSKLGLQQQQMRIHNNRTSSKFSSMRAQTTSPGLSQGKLSGKYAFTGELPRQSPEFSPMAAQQKQKFLGVALQQQQLMDSFTRQQPDFLAVGNRLSMATYSKKESGEADNELCQQSQKPKRAKKGFKTSLAKFALMQATALGGLNRDLTAVGNKQRVLSISGTPANFNQTQKIKGERRQVQLGEPLSPTTNGSIFQKGVSNMPTTFMIGDSDLQNFSKEVCITGIHSPLDQGLMSPVQKVDESKKYIAMSVEFKTREGSHYTKVRANSTLSQEAEQKERSAATQALKSINNPIDAEHTVQMQIMLSQSPSQRLSGAIGTRLTVKRSRHDVNMHQNDIFFDHERLSVGSVKMQENFATCSVVTQPNGSINEDLSPPSCARVTSDQVNIWQVPSKNALHAKQSSKRLKLTQIGPDSKVSSMEKSKPHQLPLSSSNSSGSLQEVIKKSDEINKSPPKLLTGEDESSILMLENLDLSTQLIQEKSNRPRTTMAFDKNNIKLSRQTREGESEKSSQEGISAKAMTVLKVVKGGGMNRTNPSLEEQLSREQPSILIKARAKSPGIPASYDMLRVLKYTPIDLSYDICESSKILQPVMSRHINSKRLPSTRTSNKLMISPSVPTNFSSLEQQQQQALLDIAGQVKQNYQRAMLAQAHAPASMGQISLNNQWQGKSVLNFHKTSDPQISGNNVGMKGSKLPMNSQFRKIQSILKQRAQDTSLGFRSRNNLQSQTATCSPPTAPICNLTLNSGRRAIVGVIEQSPNGAVSSQTRSPHNHSTTEIAGRSRTKQSILVMQNRQIDQNKRVRDNESISKMHMMAVFNSMDNLKDNEKNPVDLKKGQLTQISSHEGNLLEKNYLALTSNREEPYELLLQKNKREQISLSPRVKKEENQDFSSGMVRQVSLGPDHMLMQKTKVEGKHQPKTVISMQASTQEQDEVATYNINSDEGIEIESVGIDGAVLDLSTEFIHKEEKLGATGLIYLDNDDAGMSWWQKATEQTENYRYGREGQYKQSVNFPPMIDFNLATIGQQTHTRQDLKGNINSCTSQYRGYLPPQTMAPQRRARQSRLARSQQMRRRNRTRQEIKSELETDANMVVGKKFQPKLVFKEQEMQQLYERAEQNVQEVVNTILQDDLESQQQQSSYAYAKKTTKVGKGRVHKGNRTALSSKQQICWPVLGGISPCNSDSIKYEFIEKLLKNPDVERTKKTLQEMMNLYQELVEKNLSDKSASVNATIPTAAQYKDKDHQSSIVYGGSQQSIVVHTDRQPTLLASKRASELGTIRTYTLKKNLEQGERSLDKQRESDGVLKTMRASLELNASVMRGVIDPGSPGTVHNYNNMSHSSDKRQSGNIVAENINWNIAQNHRYLSQEAGQSAFILDSSQKRLITNERDEQSNTTIGIKTRPSFKLPIDCKNILQQQDQKQLQFQWGHDLDIVANSDSPGFHPKTDEDGEKVRTQHTIRVPLRNMNSVDSSSRFNINQPQHQEQAQSPGTLSVSGPNIFVENSKNTLEQSKAKVLLSYTTEELLQPFESKDIQVDPDGNSSFDNIKFISEPPVPAAEQPISATEQPKVELIRQRPQELRKSLQKWIEPPTIQDAMKPTKELCFSALSPRIHQLEEMIKKNSRKPKIKTRADVQSAAHVLGFSKTTKAATPFADKNEQINRQMAQTAYLWFQANKLNNNMSHGKIVGKELRQTSQRMKFAEQMFPARQEILSPKKFLKTNNVAHKEGSITVASYIRRSSMNQTATKSQPQSQLNIRPI